MTGDEKAAAVEKSQLVAGEKSQQLKEEKKPNAPPTEWELLKLIVAVLIVGNDFVVDDDVYCVVVKRSQL